MFDETFAVSCLISLNVSYLDQPKSTYDISTFCNFLAMTMYECFDDVI